MYCSKCGKEIQEGSQFCPYCGADLSNSNFNNPINNNSRSTSGSTISDPNDTGSVGWGILGFFIPLIGLILFCVWKSTQPKNAKSAGIGALIGFILNFVWIIAYIICFITSVEVMN